MKRIILVLTVALMMAAMTLGFAGSAMAQTAPGGAGWWPFSDTGCIMFSDTFGACA
jgi:hypothetical protein